MSASSAVHVQQSPQPLAHWFAKSPRQAYTPAVCFPEHCRPSPGVLRPRASALTKACQFTAFLSLPASAPCRVPGVEVANPQQGFLLGKGAIMAASTLPTLQARPKSVPRMRPLRQAVPGAEPASSEAINSPTSAGKVLARGPMRIFERVLSAIQAIEEFAGRLPEGDVEGHIRRSAHELTLASKQRCSVEATFDRLTQAVQQLDEHHTTGRLRRDFENETPLVERHRDVRSDRVPKFVPRIENSAKRQILLSEFRSREGTPFNVRLARPKAVRLRARDTAGNSYDIESPGSSRDVPRNGDCPNLCIDHGRLRNLTHRSAPRRRGVPSHDDALRHRTGVVHPRAGARTGEGQARVPRPRSTTPRSTTRSPTTSGPWAVWPTSRRA